MKASGVIIGCAVALVLIVQGIIVAAQPEYSVVKKIQVGGEGGWDYITADDSSSRLFISHGKLVNVVNLKNDSIIGEIPDTKGVHGIALAYDLNKGFVSNGKDSSVTVFDLKSFKTLTKVTVSGQNPDAILYDKFSHQVFTFNGRSSNATVIDAKENKVTGTIALDGKPEFPATNESGSVYVNIEDKNLVEVINSKTSKVEQKWPIAPGEEPSGLALDNQNHRLFIVCHNKLMVIMDAQTGKVIASFPIGEGVDGVVFDPMTKRAFSSNGEGTITVVQEENKDSFKVVETIATQKGARTIALNAITHHLYLPTAEFNPPPSATPENPKPRPSVKPGTFVILDVAPTKK